MHDAVKLDAMGAYGIAPGPSADTYGGRLDILEMAAAIEESARAPVITARAEALAAARREVMRAFARRLREEQAEFSAAENEAAPVSRGRESVVRETVYGAYSRKPKVLVRKRRAIARAVHRVLGTEEDVGRGRTPRAAARDAAQVEIFDPGPEAVVRDVFENRRPPAWAGDSSSRGASSGGRPPSACA